MPIFFLFLFFSLVGSLTVPSASFRVVNSNFFDSLDTRIAQWVVAFDEDVMVMDFLGCSGYYRPDIYPSPNCDYSTVSGCGTQRNTTFSNTNVCDPTLCRFPYEWDTVEFGKETIILICNQTRALCTSQLRYARTFISASQLEVGLRLHVRNPNFETDVWFSINHPGDPKSPNDWLRPDDSMTPVTYGIEENMAICPRRIPAGTFFSRLYARFVLPTLEKRIYYTITSISIPVYQKVPSNRCSSGSLQDWQCLEDAIPFRANLSQVKDSPAFNWSAQIWRFSFPLPEACPISVGVRIIIGIATFSPTYFVDTEPVIYRSNPTANFSVSGKWNFVFRYNPLSTTFHFGCEDLPRNLYITVANRGAASSSQVYLSPIDVLVSTDPELMSLKKVTTMSVEEFSGRSLTWFELVCPDLNGNFVTYRPCSALAPISFLPFTDPPCDSGVIFRLLPNDRPPFWNYPPVSALDFYPSFVEEVLRGVSFHPRQIGLYKLLSTVSSSGQVTNYSSFDPEPCSIKFKSVELYLSASRMGINSTITSTPSNLECTDDLSEYDHHLKTYVDAIEEYNDVPVEKIEYSKWEVGEFGFDLRIQACLNYLDQTINYKTVNFSSFTNQCTVKNETDPCCSLELQWTQCCTFRELMSTESRPDQPNHFEILQKCPSNVDCGLQLATEYSILSEKNRCSQDNPSLTELTYSETQGWKKCMSLVFHGFTASFTLPCYDDSDCVEPHRGLKFKCDAVSHRCLSDYQQLLESFVSCLVNESSTILLSLLEVDNPENNMTNALISQKVDLCLPNRGVDLNIHPYWQSSNICPVTTKDSCYDLKARFISRYINNIPYECMFRQTCTRPNSFSYSRPSGNCTITNCRVKTIPAGPSGVCPTNSCALCFEEDSQCYSTEEMNTISSREGCEGQNVCLLPNGTMVLGISEQSCSQLGECIVENSYSISASSVQLRRATCGSDPCTKVSCGSVGGRCTVMDAFEQLKNDALCIEDHPHPFNLVICDYPKRNFPIGCISNFSGSSCKQVIFRNQSSWNSKSGCEAQFPVGCRIDFFDSAYGNDSVLTNRSAAQCSCENGTPGKRENFFYWEKAEWVSSLYLPLSWVEEPLMRPNSLQTVTNLETVDELFYNAIRTWTQFWALSDINCKTYPILNELNDLICECESSELEMCKPGRIPQIIALTFSCPEQPRVWSLGQARITLGEDSLLSQCSRFKVEQAPTTGYLRFSQTPVTTSFLYEHTYQLLESVTNSKGAVVGTLLSAPGYVVLFDNANLIHRFEMCIDLPEEDPVLTPENSQKYPLWSIVVGIDDGPLQLSRSAVEVKESTVVGTSEACLNLTHQMISSSTKSVVFFLVRISATWETEDDSLSDTEFVLLCLAAVVYWVFCLGSLLIFFSTISFWDSMQSKEEYGFFLASLEIFIFGFFRGLLFTLLASERDMASAGENILNEFPTFLYLSLVIGQISSFKIDSSKSSKVLFGAVSNCVLFTLFAVVIILLDQIKNDEPSTLCRGRQVDESGSLSNSDKLRIIYKTVIGFISLVSALFLVFAGVKALNQMRDFRLKNQQVLQGLEAYELPVLIKTSVVSLSLALNCLGFIIYYSVDNPSPYFVFFLFGTEVVPLLILHTTFRQELSLKFGTSRHGTSTGPSTVDL